MTDVVEGVSLGEVRLEPLDGNVWLWGLGESVGLSEGVDEAVLALGRAVRERSGAGAQRLFLQEMIKQLTVVNCKGDCTR